MLEADPEIVNSEDGIMVYGEGTGAECRGHVQKLNSLRGEHESGKELQPIPTLHVDDFRQDSTEPRESLNSKSKWEAFCSEATHSNDMSQKGEFLDLDLTSHPMKKQKLTAGQQHTASNKRKSTSPTVSSLNIHRNDRRAPHGNYRPSSIRGNHNYNTNTAYSNCNSSGPSVSKYNQFSSNTNSGLKNEYHSKTEKSESHDIDSNFTLNCSFDFSDEENFDTSQNDNRETKQFNDCNVSKHVSQPYIIHSSQVSKSPKNVEVGKPNYSSSKWGKFICEANDETEES